MVILATNRNINVLSSCTMWSVDGTFWCCPKLYYQTYTLHGLIGEKFVPLVYALMPNKKEEGYEELFQQLARLMGGGLGRVTVVLDFEKAAMNSILQVLRVNRLLNCFFHWAQMVQRKIQNKFHWKARYCSDARFKESARLVVMLAFVPLDSLEKVNRQVFLHNPTQPPRSTTGFCFL